MDDVIAKKLDSLYRALQRISDKCPSTAQEFKADIDLQDIVVLNLSRAVQLCVDIGSHSLTNLPLPPPNTMGETFDRMVEAKLISQDVANNMKKSVGFRNLAVHNYATLDLDIVYAIATWHLQDFRDFARAVSD